jgi:hypothetical protein
MTFCRRWRNRHDTAVAGAAMRGCPLCWHGACSGQDVVTFAAESETERSTRRSTRSELTSELSRALGDLLRGALELTRAELRLLMLRTQSLFKRLVLLAILVLLTAALAQALVLCLALIPMLSALRSSDDVLWGVLPVLLLTLLSGVGAWLAWRSFARAMRAIQGDARSTGPHKGLAVEDECERSLRRAD